MELQNIIYQNAKKLFLDLGYEKTTLAEIIKASDCSKGGFYHYYKSKEDILPQILDEYEEVYIRRINSYVKPEQNGYENLMNFYRTIYADNSEDALARRELYAIIVQVDKGDLFRSMQKRADGALIKMFCEIFEKTAIDGSIELSMQPIVIAKLFAREFRYFDSRMRKLIERYNITEFEQSTKLRKTILLKEEVQLSEDILSSVIKRDLPIVDIYEQSFKQIIENRNKRTNEHIN